MLMHTIRPAAKGTDVPVVQSTGKDDPQAPGWTERASQKGVNMVLSLRVPCNDTVAAVERQRLVHKRAEAIAQQFLRFDEQCAFQQKGLDGTVGKSAEIKQRVASVCSP